MVRRRVGIANSKIFRRNSMGSRLNWAKDCATAPCGFWGAVAAMGDEAVLVIEFNERSEESDDQSGVEG